MKLIKSVAVALCIAACIGVAGSPASATEPNQLTVVAPRLALVACYDSTGVADPANPRTFPTPSGGSYTFQLDGQYQNCSVFVSTIAGVVTTYTVQPGMCTSATFDGGTEVRFPTAGGANCAVDVADQHVNPNVLRVKNQLRGVVPVGSSYAIRVQCAGVDGLDESLLTFTGNSYQEVEVSPGISDCTVTSVVSGAASTWYHASSETAEVTWGVRSARVDFGGTSGGYAKVVVRQQYWGVCPRPGPGFC